MAVRRAPRKARTMGEVSGHVADQTRSDSRPSRTSTQLDAGVEVLPEYTRAKGFITNGVPLIFVTGGAGTGKSTFIRWLSAQYEGAAVIAAPTGIAALTAGGKTIHSLCQFPPAWITPKDIKTYPASPALHAKVLVIDEISMVNANLLDGLDQFLRTNRRRPEPFGGLTVVLVGDLFQLPPVVTSTTRSLFEAEYSSPKFFAAHAVRSSPFEAIELTKAFRQTDQHFVNLLGNIREGTDLPATLDALNSQVHITSDPPAGSVWLAPRNVDVERINQARLAQLPGPAHTYQSTVTGKFKESLYPVPGRIELKVGAQVVLTRNAKGWVNGSVGTVTALRGDRIHVRLAANGRDVEVPREVWEQFDYRVNPSTHAIERIVIGTFTQLPAIPAWAMTIHRSQGLTLDAVHLDLGAGAFESGQTYVALSRSRSMARLSLSRPLYSSDVRVDPEAQAFYQILRQSSDT